jgi:ABC-2 type transport system permease protein
MINAILVLIRTQFLIARNTFWRGKIMRKVGLVVLALALAGASYGLYWLTRGIVEGITSPEFADFLAQAARRGGLPAGFSLDFRSYLLAVPAAVLFFALVLLVLTSFTTVLSSLYLSGDIDMLLSAPVPMRAVFVVKFFGGLLAPYALLFFLLGPFMLGFGQGLGFGAGYFVAAVVALLLLPLLPTGLGALLVMVVVRVIPARRAREIVGVIGGLVGISWYIVSQFSRELSPRLANAQALDYLRRFDNPLAPSAWAARALVAAGEGRAPDLLLYGGLFAGLSIGVFLVCVALAERLYYAGWSNMSTQGGRIRTRTKNRELRTTAGTAQAGAWLSVLGSLLPPESAAVLYKDLKVFPRDLRNLQQLIFPLVLAGVWSFRLVTGGQPSAARGAPPFFSSLNALASAGISFYICLVLSGAIGGAGVNREGKGFWLLKVAPISARQLLLGKLTLAYLPFPIVGTLFVVALSILQHSAPSDFARSLVLVLVAGLGVSSISLGISAAFPKFNWENPRQQNSVRAGCLTPLLYLTYLAVVVGVVLGVPELGRLVPDFALALTVASWAVFLGLTALVVWAALTFGAARLEQLDIA